MEAEQEICIERPDHRALTYMYMSHVPLEESEYHCIMMVIINDCTVKATDARALIWRP